MSRVTEPGKFANWIAPPRLGINKQPVNFEYVRNRGQSPISGVRTKSGSDPDFLDTLR
jgi:hypothetical protein